MFKQVLFCQKFVVPVGIPDQLDRHCILRVIPEYTVQETVARLRELTQGIEAERVENFTHRNLERWFGGV